MNSIEDQSSGDSSHLSSNSPLTSINTEGVPIFHPEPGTSLANAINEQMSEIHSKQVIQPIASVLSHTESNNDSERQSLNDSENVKYKTELCRNFSTYGLCSYSSRCQFAHGLEELRCRTRHPKYKTELCRNFLSGHCKYGSRCQFLHNSDQTNHTIPLNNQPIISPTAVAAYLLTNMLAQSAALGLVAHQSTLTTLANCHSRSNSPTEFPLRRTTIPYNCGIELQQIPHLHYSSNIFHGLSMPQNQNNNDFPLSTTHCQSQGCPNPTINVPTEDIQLQRIRKSSVQI